MDCKIAIRSVPERKSFLPYLSKHLPAEARIYVDEMKFGARANFHRVLESIGDSRCLHMEDDVWLTERFVDKAFGVIDSRPNQVIQFFSMRKKDLVVGCREERGSTFMMNQCFYLPAGMGTELLKYYKAWPGKDVHRAANDIFIADYMKWKRLRYYIHVPSLVQHRPVVSAIDPRRSRSRQSPSFTGGIYE